MLDLQYYLQQCLNEKDKEFFLKYFKTNSFYSVKGLIYKLSHPEEMTSWITNIKAKNELFRIFEVFSSNLQEMRPKYKDMKEYLLEQLDDTAGTFPEFEWKKDSHGGICPNCGEKELFATNKNAKGGIKCNRENKCGYSSDVLSWLVSHKGMSAGGALNELADRVGVDLKEYEKSLEVHIMGTGASIQVRKEAKRVEHKSQHLAKEIAYESIKSNQINNFDLKEMQKNYKNLDNASKFSLVCTAIYYLSKKTNQTKKALYYKSRGISGIETPALKEKVIQIVNELGFFSKEDLPKLVDYLTKIYPLEDLVEFGIINDGKHKVPYSFKHYSEEGFVVIPNFDIYSNLVNGLKLRNIKLADWQDKSMKEPELSYKRIANPYPYGLKLQSLLNNETFRLFEGQVDMFSLPSKEGNCDIAIPGVNGLDESQLGLFKDKKVELWFDQDDAGQKSANGTLKISLDKKEIDLNDLAGKSFIEELQRTKDKSLKIDISENIATVKELVFPKNKSGLERFRLFETIISRRNISFSKKQTKGLKDKLFDAGAAEVVVVQWDTSYGSDVNEVLKNGKIEKIIQK